MFYLYIYIVRFYYFGTNTLRLFTYYTYWIYYLFHHKWDSLCIQYLVDKGKCTLLSWKVLQINLLPGGSGPNEFSLLHIYLNVQKWANGDHPTTHPHTCTNIHHTLKEGYFEEQCSVPFNEQFKLMNHIVWKLMYVQFQDSPSTLQRQTSYHPEVCGLLQKDPIFF